MGSVSILARTKAAINESAPSDPHRPTHPSDVRRWLQVLCRCPSGLQPSSGTTSASPGIALVDGSTDYLNLLVVVVRLRTAFSLWRLHGWTQRAGRCS